MHTCSVCICVIGHMLAFFGFWGQVAGAQACKMLGQLGHSVDISFNFDVDFSWHPVRIGILKQLDIRTSRSIGAMPERDVIIGSEGPLMWLSSKVKDNQPGDLGEHPAQVIVFAYPITTWICHIIPWWECLAYA